MSIVILIAFTCLMPTIRADYSHVTYKLSAQGELRSTTFQLRRNQDKDVKKDLWCENENAVIECPRGYVIEIVSAVYGKQDKSKCSFPGNNVDDCAASNSLDIVKLKCNRKQTCSLKASNNVFGDPCKHIIKYLEVSYKCNAGDIITKFACEGDTLEIKCPSNHYLWIANAWYGRRNQKYCNPGPAPGPKPLQHNHCNANSALGLVETRCDFLNLCAIEVKNDVFGDPCVGTHKYFEVDYQCLDRGAE